MDDSAYQELVKFIWNDGSKDPVDFQSIPEALLERPELWTRISSAAAAENTPPRQRAALIALLCDLSDPACTEAAQARLQEIAEASSPRTGPAWFGVEPLRCVLRAAAAKHRSDWDAAAAELDEVFRDKAGIVSDSLRIVRENVRSSYIGALANTLNVKVFALLLQDLQTQHKYDEETVAIFLNQGSDEHLRAAMQYMRASLEIFTDSRISDAGIRMTILKCLVRATEDQTERDAWIREMVCLGSIDESLTAIELLSSLPVEREANSRAVRQLLWKLLDQDVDPQSQSVQRTIRSLQRVDPKEYEDEVQDLKFEGSGQRATRHPGLRRKRDAYHLFLSTPAEEAADLPDIVDLLRSVQWLRGQGGDSRIMLPESKRRRLYAGICRLHELRTLARMIESPESDCDLSSNYDADLTCPIHWATPHSHQKFMNLMRVESTRHLSQRALSRFRELAQESFEFRLSREGMAFLERDGRKPFHRWQRVALDSWAAHGRQGLVSAATGSGKSQLGVAALLESQERPAAAILLTHRLALKGQWKKDELRAIPEAQDIEGYAPDSGLQRFIDNGPNRNLWELSCEDPKSDIETFRPEAGQVLLSLDISLANRPLLLPDSQESSLLVADEVHRFNSQGSRSIIFHQFSRKLGLSATIGSRDTAIREAFGHVVCDYQLGHAIADGITSEFALLTIRVPLLRKTRVWGKEKHEMTLVAPVDAEPEMAQALQDQIDHAQRILKETRTQLDNAGFSPDTKECFAHAVDRVQLERDPRFQGLARNYTKAKRDLDTLMARLYETYSVLDLLAESIRANKYTLIFANWNSEGDRISKQLQAHGVKVVSLNADTEQLERNNAFSDLHCGLIDALVAPRILDEGVNIPKARCGLILGPGVEGYRQAIQRAGRVLRLNDDRKPSLIVLAAGINTSEDPNFNSSDSTHAILARFASDGQVYIRDHTDTAEIKSMLDRFGLRGG